MSGDYAKRKALSVGKDDFNVCDEYAKRVQASQLHLPSESCWMLHESNWWTGRLKSLHAGAKLYWKEVDRTWQDATKDMRTFLVR